MALSRAEIRTVAYGELPEQQGDLYLPEVERPPVVCLLHGGFWRKVYRRDQMDAVARDLVGRGFAVWNREYRGIGAGGGWPGTLDDVAQGIDHLAELVLGGTDMDLGQVVAAGHSAGGHLALWSAARERAAGLMSGTRPARVRVAAVAGLAPVADLAAAHRLRLGNGVVGDFLGGSPAERPERYAACSPMALLPLGVPQLIVHGTADDTVPIEIARDYVRAAAGAGDPATLVELPDRGHFDFLDPASGAHAALCHWLTAGRSRPNR
jgi:acetyl esterase/lipase